MGVYKTIKLMRSSPTYITTRTSLLWLKHHNEIRKHVKYANISHA